MKQLMHEEVAEFRKKSTLITRNQITKEIQQNGGKKRGLSNTSQQARPLKKMIQFKQLHMLQLVNLKARNYCVTKSIPGS